MLEKKVPFCIDHFSIATTHRDRPIDLVTKLGFTTAALLHRPHRALHL